MGIRDKQRYFNALAAGWDALPAPESAPEKVCLFVRRATAPGVRRVLDVGCGTGVLVPALLEACPQAVITELDLAEEMLRANAAKLGSCFQDSSTMLPRGAGLQPAAPQAKPPAPPGRPGSREARTRTLSVPGVRYVCADGAFLPFRAACFDLVLCFGVLPHFEDLAGALRELERVLRPEGALAVGHLMGSAELNAFHRSLEGPVAGDVLLAAEALGEMLGGLGWAVSEAEEAPDWYFVRGRKLQ